MESSLEVKQKPSAWKALSNIKCTSYIDDYLKKFPCSGRTKKVVLTQHELIRNIQQDCKNFLDKFIAQGEITFAAFSKLWTDIGFTFIFCGKSEHQHTNEYVEEVFGVAKAMWLPPKRILQRAMDVCQIPHNPVPSMNERIAAFYMVYALFKVQPSYKSTSARGHVQITILDSDMENLMAFVETIRGRQLQESQFMLCTLFTEKAFKFCVTYYENPRKHLPYCEALEMQIYENKFQGLTKETVQTLSRLFCDVADVSSDYIRCKLRSPENCDTKQEMEILSSFVNILKLLYPKGAESVTNVPRVPDTSLDSTPAATVLEEEKAPDPVISDDLQQTQTGKEVKEQTRTNARLNSKKIHGSS